ncbi:hypothetical protein ACLKA6_000745 [Drosophila palustris]
MYCLGPILFLLLALQPWRMADGECCYHTYARFGVQPNDNCGNYNGSTSYWWSDSCWNRFCGNLEKPTPCCGVGSCNIFCCNCDFGCKKGNVAENLLRKFGTNITMIKPDLGKVVLVKMMPNATDTVDIDD